MPFYSVAGTTVSVMRKVILQVELQPSEASLSGVRTKLGLDSTQIDAEYGVRAVRPEQNVYVVRVDADVAREVRGEAATPPAAGDVRVALVH